MFRAASFVEKRRKYAANLAVLKTYNFAPIHSNMCGRVGSGLQASSTGIDPNDPTTWKIGEYDLVQVAHDAFATLNSLSELKPTS